ncbi:hypothetical protein [Deinococcus taeanensis]|uniref:hypothetical protein n=1 Tax=Deinococcus taeanensis TaxID=2737050 RepID=UPI0032E801A4
MIGILAAILISNNRANDTATQSYIRSMVSGVETLHDSVTGKLPLRPPLAPLLLAKLLILPL